MQNVEIRKFAQESGVRLWQIAYELKLHDCNFSRKLRKELSKSEKEQIFAIIEKLRGENVATA